MFKKLFALFAASCLLLSGCIPSVELNDRAIVQAIGVDRSADGYRLTLQIFFPDGAGGQTGVDASKQNAKIISAEGKTMADAIQTATLKQGKQIFYGHNRLIIIGEETAKDGIDDILPFFNNGYQSRPSVDVMIAEGNAEDILTADIQQGIIPAESVQNMVDNYTKNGSVIKTRLLDIVESFFDDSASVAIPRIVLTEEPTGAESQAESEEEGAEEGVEKSHAVMMQGTAILKNGKQIGTLNEEETRGLVWMRDKVEETLMIFPFEGRNLKQANAVSLEVYKSSTEIKVSIEKGIPVYEVKIRALGRIDELNLTSRFSFMENDVRQMEKSGEKLIRQECESVFRKAAQEYRADIFSFGVYLMKENLSYWKTIKKDWPDAIARTDIRLDVGLNIDRLGLQSNDLR